MDPSTNINGRICSPPVCVDQVLTKDPVAHTLINGKRLLCNDMWGAGIIALGLVLGFTEMDSVSPNLAWLRFGLWVLGFVMTRFGLWALCCVMGLGGHRVGSRAGVYRDGLGLPHTRNPKP